MSSILLVKERIHQFLRMSTAKIYNLYLENKIDLSVNEERVVIITLNRDVARQVAKDRTVLLQALSLLGIKKLQIILGKEIYRSFPNLDFNPNKMLAQNSLPSQLLQEFCDSEHACYITSRNDRLNLFHNLKAKQDLCNPPDELMRVAPWILNFEEEIQKRFELLFENGGIEQNRIIENYECDSMRFIHNPNDNTWLRKKVRFQMQLQAFIYLDRPSYSSEILQVEDLGIFYRPFDF